MNRPGIYRLGTVTDDGETVTVSGWGLTYCVTRCACHEHPATKQLSIWENQSGGLLGLCQFSGGKFCGCCEPWTAAELQAVLRDVSDVGTMEVAG